MFDFTKEVNLCLRQLQQGDAKKFDELMLMTTSHLLGVAKYYLVDKSLAEDVVEEVYIHVIQYIHSYDTDQSGYTWLCKIPQNMAFSFNKKQSRDRDAERKFASTLPSECFNSALEFINFFSHLKGLDNTDRLVAYHRFYLEETEQEIGDIMSVSKVAISNRIKKILKIVDKNKKTG